MNRRKFVWKRQRHLTAAPFFPQRERWYVSGHERLHANVERDTYADGWTAFVKGAPAARSSSETISSETKQEGALR